MQCDERGVWTPVQSSQEVDAAGQAGNVAWSSGGGQRRLRVLVADDCRDGADSLSTLVQMWGHDVCVAYDGVAAHEMASAFRPDVLVLDIGMPKMDGYRVARHIRQQKCFDDTLLIAVTGWADRPHHRLGDEAGFDHYLIKPVDPTTLEALLAVARSRLAHAAAVSFANPSHLLARAMAATRGEMSVTANSNALFFLRFAEGRRTGQCEEHDLLAGHGADVVMQA